MGQIQSHVICSIFMQMFRTSVLCPPTTADNPADNPGSSSFSILYKMDETLHSRKDSKATLKLLELYASFPKRKQFRSQSLQRYLSFPLRQPDHSRKRERIPRRRSPPSVFFFGGLFKTVLFQEVLSLLHLGAIEEVAPLQQGLGF